MLQCTISAYLLPMILYAVASIIKKIIIQIPNVNVKEMKKKIIWNEIKWNVL